MLLDNSEVATAAFDDPANLHAAFCELVSEIRWKKIEEAVRRQDIHKSPPTIVCKVICATSLI